MGIAHYIEAREICSFDSEKITDWKQKVNAFAKTNENGKMPRSYIKVVEGSDSSAKTDITNSEITPLRSNPSSFFGLSYYAGS